MPVGSPRIVVTGANVRKLDSASATIDVFTFKEGALSKLAHDLQLRAGAFELLLDEAAGTVHARIDARSLQVVSAMADGRPAPSLLGPSSVAEIERNAQRAVLEADRFPTIQFEGRLGDEALAGELELHGVRRPIRMKVRREADALTAEAELDQRDFGITPYKALLGALRIQPVVRVVARVPTAS